MVRKPKNSSSQPCKGGADLLVWSATLAGDEEQQCISQGTRKLGFLIVKVNGVIEIHSENKLEKIAVTKE